MTRLVRWAGNGAIGLAGLAVGWLATPSIMARTPLAKPVAVGPWRTSLTAGGIDAGHYTRAHIARTGLLALNRAETIYFEAGVDDSGAALRANCSYDLAGTTLPARWWSITAYADDFFLIPNSAKRFSVTPKTAAAAADGRFAIALGPRDRGPGWLPTGTEGGGFNLLLRLYNPDGDIALDPARAGLPGIKRVGACAP